MKGFLVIALAATALAPVSALAQPRTAEPPVKWEDAPHAQMRMPGHHGQAAQHGPHVPPRVRVHRVPGHPGSARSAVVTHHRPMRGHAGGHELVRHHGDRGAWRGHRGFKNYSNYRRIDRGFALPHAWWGPRYHIQNWSMYGLPAPVHGGRWVRYYDDALMIDGHGRVHDGRWGMAWDQWQDQWSYDGSGVPVYVGNGDFYPGDEDYAWVEGQDGYAESYGSGHQGGDYAYGGQCTQACAYPGPPHHPYGHGYGWTWGYGAGMVVTETTVTTSPTVVTETWIEEEVVHERRAHKPRKYRPKARRHQPKPRPYGERG